MRLKQWAVLNKLFRLPKTQPPRDEILLRLWNKHFLTKIYRNIQTTNICFQSASRLRYLGVKKWCSANILPDTKQKMHARKFVKSERFLAVLREILLSMSSELRFIKLMRFFWAKLYCKNCKNSKNCRNCFVKIIFFISFCCFWQFLLENLKLKETSGMSTGTNRQI